ncbi:ATPase [Sulfolobus sp. A20]|uniref:nucleotide-binding protein n=1 Tax=Saccharolobus sp. A20 TaxID=1891280 RepID=UPI00084612DC|nr:ParA family protein [Sulfolobus sp. A20]TRM73529.1 ParA family protein [Sulfolobus sp. E5]TRM77979.1 ParA family protein [Sulfolobus sp. A20-N-F8]TRM87972.1 ParA family protein [Sulfolobus sp. A20-N-G8]TRM98784.1 ParA family protein [Sulfolobus sp. F1]AOL16974.1 ATPase [Sulfolobus sp. A20]
MLRINVLGFKGGSGKSMIAYYLAKELSQYYAVTLVDKTFSGTISKIYNLNNSIFSFLRGKNESFYTTKGNLNVINMSFSTDTNLEEVDLNGFKYLYKKLLDDSDIVIVDHSSLPHDFAIEIELKAFIESFKAYTYNVILILSSDELSIKRYLNYTSLLNDFIKHEVEDLLHLNLPENARFLRIWAIVLNKVIKEQENSINELLKGDEILQKPAKFIVPFYPLFIQKHFKDIEQPKEISQLVEYVKSIIREPTSVVF